LNPAPTHEAVGISHKKLVCEQTIPENTKLELFGGQLMIDREEFENLPVSIPGDMVDRMERVSQIGLKNIWLGSRPDSHVRWEHARGTYTVGLIWLKFLYEHQRIPQRLQQSPFLDYRTAQILVGYSLLLHDYGHLFFSHLLDEVLQSINWIPSAPGVRSLEYRVLLDRLNSNGDLDLAFRQSLPATSHQALDPRRSVSNLMFGWAGTPWLQSIVNGPVDADKIDYLRRDQAFLERAGYPVHSRLNFGPTLPNHPTLPWMEQFLSEQFVNHFGFLCLPGRSALAAADLWRERMFLYERFYLAPAVRVAERIVMEIIQGFLIRYVMSSGFSLSTRRFLADMLKGDRELNLPGDFAEKIHSLTYSAPDVLIDVVEVKYQIVVELLTKLAGFIGGTGVRDWECLKLMRDSFCRPPDDRDGTPSLPLLDKRYLDFVTRACKTLDQLKDGTVKLDEVADDAIVRHPLQFLKADLPKVRNVVRSFQHQFMVDALIDVVVMPSVLSIPSAPDRHDDSARPPAFAGLLVPKGDVASWGPGSTQLVPLDPSQLKELERPFGRITVIAFDDTTDKSRREYIFDRLLATLSQEGIAIQEVSAC